MKLAVRDGSVEVVGGEREAGRSHRESMKVRVLVTPAPSPYLSMVFVFFDRLSVAGSS